MVSRKNIVVSKDSIGIDKDLTKDHNLNTFKMYCKRRKSSARFPDRRARIVCTRVIALLAMHEMRFLLPRHFSVHGKIKAMGLQRFSLELRTLPFSATFAGGT